MSEGEEGQAAEAVRDGAPDPLSTRKMRAHFWELVEILRPRSFTDLRQSVHPLFERRALAHFSKRLRCEAPRFSLRHDISQEEVREFSAALSLRRGEDTELHEQLRGWQTSFHLTDDWCGELALKTMHGWLWPEQSWEEESTSEVNWLSEETILEFRLNRFQHWNVLYEYVAWNRFFETGTEEDWLREETARFKAHLERLRGGGHRIPYGIVTAFRRALKADLNARKRALKRTLDTPVKATEHFEWLVRHQIPECESYRGIAKRPAAACVALTPMARMSLAGPVHPDVMLPPREILKCRVHPDATCPAHPAVYWTTVRAGIKSAALLTGLSLCRGLPAGRPRGKRDGKERVHIVARRPKNQGR